MLLRYSLLAATAVLFGTVAAIFISYKKEISSARAGVRRGSLINDTDAGRIEYAEHGAGMPLLSIHGAGGGFDQGLSLSSKVEVTDLRCGLSMPAGISFGARPKRLPRPY